MNFKSKIFPVLAVFGVLVALSPAPFVHTHHGSPVPHTTQELLAQHQALAKTMPVVGSITMTPRTTYQHGDRQDHAASKTVAKMQSKLDGTDKKNAIAVLKEAEHQVEQSHRSPLFNLIWVVVAGCFGYGIFFAFRKWADKNIPDPTNGPQKLW